MLASATEHYRRQQRLTTAGLTAARRSANDPARLVTVVTAFQLAAAQEASAAVGLMLAEQNLQADPAGTVNTSALAGIASDGRALDTLFAQADNDTTFDLMVVTQLQDVARAAAGLAMASRPNVSGYVRMLNPPSCSRCAILAGKFFRWNAGFSRHPKCDCRHIPTTENLAGDLTTDPRGYFDSLPTAADLDARYPNLSREMRRDAGILSQEDVFTRAGAQAIRDGADIGQVVNARRGARGMAPAGGRYTLAEQRMLRGGRDRSRLERVDVYGQQVYITSEGMTRRGLAGQTIGARTGYVGQQAETVTRNTRTGAQERTVTRQRARAPRLMPESIYELATDRADAIRLLKAHGYLL